MLDGFCGYVFCTIYVSGQEEFEVIKIAVSKFNGLRERHKRIKKKKKNTVEVPLTRLSHLAYSHDSTGPIQVIH